MGRKEIAMPEDTNVVDPQENQDELVDPIQDADLNQEPKKEEKPTLDGINAKLDKIIAENEVLKKQNLDKDSHIKKIHGENKELRDSILNLQSSLEGKTERQKDAILEKHRKDFIEKGYDDKSVDLLLDKISVIAEEKAQRLVSAIVADSAQGLIESDPDIDQTFLANNEDAIMEEYHSYKQEVTPRKIKSNLKKAYNQVKLQLAEKGKRKKDDTRDEMIEGARPSEKGKHKTANHEEDFVKSIETAGATNSHFI